MKLNKYIALEQNMPEEAPQHQNGSAHLIKHASAEDDLLTTLNILLVKQDEQLQQLQNLLILMNIIDER
jgi:hypothetical protein